MVQVQTAQNTDALAILERVKLSIRNRSSLIHVRGSFSLTKTRKNDAEAILLRDLDLEEEVQHWIGRRVGDANRLMQRYLKYDRRLQQLSPPQHFPVRVLKGQGSIASGQNIFLFFPECLGMVARDSSDVIGFEFVDIWSDLFSRAVYPCWLDTVDNDSALAAATELLPRLQKTITLASIYHEIGHRVGPFRVSPSQDPALKISRFHLDVLGELSTDLLLCIHLKEFPEISQFILMQRLFWFSRRGFADNPTSARINEDNDSWIGAYLFNQLECSGVLSERDGRLKIRWDRLSKALSETLAEIDLLGAKILGRPENAQDSEIDAWMKGSVACSESGEFILPPGLRRLFQRCSRIPEIPQFHPLLPQTHEGTSV